MDSKINKKRLSNFFQYEWIILAIVIAVAILIMELLYTVLAVRLTVGQQYKIYYDENVYSVGSAFSDSLGYDTSDSVFSYDVLDFSTEILSSDFNVLATRLSVYEGDMIFSDIKTDDSSEEDMSWNNRANILIDNGYICSFDNLLKDAKEYITQFLNSGDEISVSNLDEKRIEEYFLIRQKNDNRFRTDKEKEEGKKLEVERIKSLVLTYLYFDKAYEYGKANDWFYSYKKYTYSINAYKEDQYYQEYLDAYKDQNTENYALNVYKLSENHQGKHPVEDYVTLSGTTSSENVVLMVFDFIKEQKDLQFESLAVINRLIQNCSGYMTAEEFPTI